MHCVLYDIYQNGMLHKATFKLYKKDKEYTYSIEYK